MRTNSFIKLINTELNRELRDKNMTSRDVRKKELQAYIDKVKNRIELFVKEQIHNNTVALIRCACRHLESSHDGGDGPCRSCDCAALEPKKRSPLILALGDDLSLTDEIFFAA